MVIINLKMIESDIINIYENNNEKLINARELFYSLRGNSTKTKFSDWIKDRIFKYQFLENVDYIPFRNFTKGDEKGFGNRTTIEYYLTLDTAKEICMIENNDVGRKIRRYFINIEKRYKKIINSTNDMFDFMKYALEQIDDNKSNIIKAEKAIFENKKEIDEIKKVIDIKIKNEYCQLSDVAEQLNIYSEKCIPHSNFIGAIARQLGYKISYKHFYEDEYIAITKDISKNEYWQVYLKPLAVEKIIQWFKINKEHLYYEIQYVRNTKNGKQGKIREKGYKIENICYKILNKKGDGYY